MKSDGPDDKDLNKDEDKDEKPSLSAEKKERIKKIREALYRFDKLRIPENQEN